MTRPRTPTNVLKLRGADKNHPARIKERDNEPQNVNPVGDPPENLNETEQSAWHQIVRESIEGVLGEADRIALEQACKLYAKSKEGDLTGQEHTQFFRYLSQFGMMPADRSKISIPQKEAANKFDD